MSDLPTPRRGSDGGSASRRKAEHIELTRSGAVEAPVRMRNAKGSPRSRAAVIRVASASGIAFG